MDISTDEEVPLSFENCRGFSSREEVRRIAQSFINSLKNNEMDEDFALNGLEALCQITSEVLNKTLPEENEEYFGETFWLKDINAAMEHFPDCASLQETACRCLSALLQECPELCGFIGEAEEGKIPLSHCVYLALKKHFKSSDVFQSSCNVIALMASSCELLQQEFINKSWHSLILDKMAVSKDPGEWHLSFQVLVSLSRRNTYFKTRLLKEDILSRISNVFEEFPLNSQVQEQAIILLATLANDLEFVRQQCIVDQLHLILLDVLESFESEESLVEVTFEALGVICAADGIPDVLRKANGVRVVLGVMTKHMRQRAIQKKGIVLLQLLVTNHELKPNTLSTLVSVIKNAMDKFPKDPDIQTESCVALHLLARNDYDRSLDLMRLHVHEQFFRIFENFPRDDGVLDVASGCIYLLACTHDLKNQMLLSMCALGYVRAVECLIQLGADVNYSEEDNTPLCLACRANNLELVNYLLRQGVADVHNALALCLDLERHNIAGFLLKHMGHDEEGGTITLTGLKLGTLQVEWLAPAFIGNAVYSSHIASNQWWELVRKAREMKLMRHRLSSSFCSTLEDDDDSFATGRISPWGGNSVDEESSPEMPQRGCRLPSNSREGSISTATSTLDIAELGDEGISVDSSGRYQLTSLMSARLQSVSGASIPYSSNDPRLVTVLETTRDIILPETDTPNEAFCLNESDLVTPPRSRRYSDSYHVMPSTRMPSTPLFLRRLANLKEGAQESAPKPVSPKAPKKSMSRSKSGSMIDSEMLGAGSAGRNPVHRLALTFNQIHNVDILARSSSALSAHLSSVLKLDLSHNKLETIPADMNRTMPQLRHLVLRNNHLREIPAWVFTNNSLERLDLSHNNIAHVEKPTNLLSNFLSHLNLSNNKIKDFPVCFQDCFALLTVLDLSFNWLSALPDQPVHMSRLQVLNLSHNTIQAIPAQFLSQMKDLESFKASHNGLKRLPESIAPFLMKLGVVKLSHNHLAERAPFHITKFVLFLPNVHTVDLSENGLQNVAAPLDWATLRLKDLNLSYNEIRSIDLTKDVNSWAFLTRLDLSFNHFKQIPKGIGKLKSLGQLNVSGNTKITVLPDEMGNLGKLWEFLHDDVKLDLNASILRGRTRDLVGHFHARLKNSIPYPQRKVVVCGPRGGGKSTLLRYLALSRTWKRVHVQDKSKTKSKGKGSSESLEVQKWLISDVRADCRCCSRRNVTLILRFWEFPGSNASVCVHRCFLSETALHMLVYDVSAGADEVDKLRPWLANIHDQCPNSGVIIVGTHMDKIPAVRQQSTLKNVFDHIKKIHSTAGLPEIRGHFTLNCSNKDPVLDSVARRLLNLAMACNTKAYQIHNHKVPKSFIDLQKKIEERVSGMKQKSGVVDQGYLKKIVQEYQLDIDKEELNEAVVFLRQSGALVNYAKPAANLNKLFFLRPPRLAALIANVVTFFDPSSHSGLVERDNLCNVIIKDGFSEMTVPPILRLLEDFEIALPVSVSRYLITSHLVDSPPESMLPLNRVLRRRYTMLYAPVGLWPRLLVYLLLYSQEMIGEQRHVITKQEECATYQYWKKGFSAYWTEDCCFTVEICENVMDILVPCHPQGHVLLGNLAYHTDTLFREWFPNLCGVDTMFGYSLLKKTTFCISCQQHQFPIEDCVAMARTGDCIECPAESVVHPLDQLVPDVLLSHLDQRYFTEEGELDFDETPEAMLGEGSFGRVYRAKYKERCVAVKVFRGTMELESFEHIEHELQFLTKLRHPSIIGLIGLCRRPQAIAIMELAPLGSLNMICRREQKLSRGIQHRIAMQVAEGLVFLHQNAIVYRDLKPHNILIFSLAAGTLINAKISDFGSSRYTTPCGFIASEGTPGYRAPEVARGDVGYNEKADIFSLGMLLYELATGGKQPFSNLKFRNELDEAVISGRPLDPIVITDTPPWPDMQDLLDHMLEAQPENRPTADQVYQRLSDPEFISLKQDIAVCKGQAVECMTVRRYTENNCGKMEMWIGSGASDWTEVRHKDKKNDDSTQTRMSQLSRLDLSCSRPEGCKGMILPDGRIMSIAAVGENLILVGTQTGHLWVYDTRKERFHAMSNLPDAVLCIRHSSVDHQDHVFAGLANGQLAMYYVFELENPPKTARIFDVGEHVCCLEKPMICLAVARKRLLCGVGHNIVVFKLGTHDVIPESHWSVATDDSPHKGLVSNIVVNRQGVWTSTKGSTHIHLWDFKTQTMRGYFNCEEMRASETREETSRGMRVVSMLIQNNVLWVGTGSGGILLIDTRSMAPLMTMKRHKAAVRCLATAVLNKDGKPISVVLSGGLGFVPRQSWSPASSSHDFGYVLVWESGIHKEAEHLHEYKQKRQEWLSNYVNK